MSLEGPEDDRGEAARLPEAGHHRAAPDPPPTGGAGGDGRAGADRDRGDGLPVPGRGLLTRGPVPTDPRRRGRAHRVPDEPRLGRRGAVRPRPGPPGHDLHPARRIPARRERVRRGTVRHVPARGADHRPAAAAPARGVLGGAGARGHRPGLPARQPDRRLRRRDVRRLRVAPGPGDRCSGRPPVQRQPAECGVGADLVHLRVRGAGGDGGHGVFVVAGVVAPGGAVAALGGEHPGPGRRRRRDGHAAHLRRVRAPARPVARRAVQGVLGCRGGDGVG